MGTNNNVPKKVIVGVSGRHVHLSQEHVDILFGNDYELTKFRDLKQIGEYAAHEKVNIITENDKILNVRVLGPVRSETQVEISKADARRLKVNPPVRNSGDLKGSVGLVLEGPNGYVKLDQGCIIATRHIHLSPKDAEYYEINNNQIVRVLVNGEKGGILDNVYCKVKDTYVLELHIDVDDANAFLVNNEDYVEFGV